MKMPCPLALAYQEEELGAQLFGLQGEHNVCVGDSSLKVTHDWLTTSPCRLLQVRQLGRLWIGAERTGTRQEGQSGGSKD